MKAINLSTDKVLDFDGHCTAFYAVAYAYHVESGSTASRFFRSNQDFDGWWMENTPFVEGEKTVSAGDWCAIKKGKA